MTNRFDMGSLGLGSLNSMLESVDFVKKAWSSFNLPASLAPTMDIDELDKRIADLKTVEQWLNVNLSMLRGTIQGMEVQRGTLAALKSFGDTLAPNAQGLAAMAAAAAQAAIRAAQPGTADGAGGGPGGHAGDQDSAAQDARPGTAGAMGSASAAQSNTPKPPASGQPAADSPDSSATDDSIAAGLSRAAAAAINPSAWWTLLQNQFNQVAQAAIAAQDTADVPPEVPDKAGRPDKAAGGTTAATAAKRKTAKARQSAEPADPRPKKRAAPTRVSRQGADSPSARRSRTKAG